MAPGWQAGCVGSRLSVLWAGWLAAGSCHLACKVVVLQLVAKSKALGDSQRVAGRWKALAAAVYSGPARLATARNRVVMAQQPHN